MGRPLLKSYHEIIEQSLNPVFRYEYILQVITLWLLRDRRKIPQVLFVFSTRKWGVGGFGSLKTENLRKYLRKTGEGGGGVRRNKLEVNNILSPIREGSKNTLREEGRVLIFPQSLAISVSPLLKVPSLKTWGFPFLENLRFNLRKTERGVGLQQNLRIYLRKTEGGWGV